MVIDDEDYRTALGLFATGITIITTLTEDSQPVGITANSFNSVSLRPAIILWSIGKAAHSLPAFQKAEHFAVHILREDQQALAQTFSRSQADKFAGLNLIFGRGGVPLLAHCAACLQCRPYAQYEAGDHILFLAEVQEINADKTARPLIYHDGHYVELAPAS